MGRNVQKGLNREWRNVENVKQQEVNRGVGVWWLNASEKVLGGLLDNRRKSIAIKSNSLHAKRDMPSGMSPLCNFD
jgi:hypothetical protein